MAFKVRVSCRECFWQLVSEMKVVSFNVTLKKTLLLRFTFGYPRRQFITGFCKTPEASEEVKTALQVLEAQWLDHFCCAVLWLKVEFCANIPARGSSVEHLSVGPEPTTSPDGMPLRLGVSEASWSNAFTTSVGSFRCQRAVALLQAPFGCLCSSPYF